MNDGISARHRAIEALLTVDRSESGSQEAIRAALYKQPRLSEVDGRLLTEIVYGSLRRQRSLDRWIHRACSRGIHSLDDRALNALRVGCYQLSELDRVPDYAAIDATTSAAAKIVGRKQRGFVHGVLRRLARERPWERGKRHDMPRWIERRIDALAEDLQRPGAEMRAAFANPAPLHIHALDEAAASSLEAALGERLRATSLPRVYRSEGGAVFQSEVFKSRRAMAQDAGSVAVGRLVNAQRGERVADVCAGRGAKSWLLAGTGAEITAFDRSAQKLASARRLATKAGMPLAATIAVDLGTAAQSDALQTFAGGFDRVLVDAPCSGLGTLRRRPEIRHRRRAADICANAALQAAILASAATMVRSGGTLVYAVCSFAREEGPHVIERFLAANPRFRRDVIDEPWATAALDAHGDLRTSPLWNGADSFYAARLIAN